MRPRISTKNVQYFLQQHYAYKNIDKFFENTKHVQKHREKVVTQMVKTFTGYHFEGGKLVCYNPYTSKNETLKIKNFAHIQSKEDLMKELSLLHKTRQQMLRQSRKRMLQLSKKKTQKRDYDLSVKMEKKKKPRLQQIPKHKDREDREQEQEL